MDSSDRVPQVLKGEAANLDPFRRSQQSVDASTLAANETLLLTDSSKNGIPVTATLTADEDSTVYSNEQGTFLVTSERILFVSKSDMNHDLAVDAECIQLHAISDETSIYIQIQENESSDCLELTISPNCGSSADSTTDALNATTCQGLFEALSKLVSMHPIPLDDDDNGGGFMDDAIIAAPSNRADASEEERAEMLQRLDDMLVVPPEYQVDKPHEAAAEGQFDDADEQQQQDGKQEGTGNDEDEDDAIL